MVVPELVAMLSRSDDSEVLIAIVDALGAAWNEEACLALLPYVSHLDDDVRLSVAQALPGGVARREAEARVAAALMVLAEDSSAIVRDWATFGLGAILDIDNAAVRATLRARVFDSDIDTRLEAIRGLAMRRDPQILPTLRDELQGETVDCLVVDAARAYADPSLEPLLVQLAERWDEDHDLLARAIATCRAGEPED